MKFGLFTIAGFLLCLSTGLTHSQELIEMPVGSKVANVVTVGKSQIPLPAGEWELVATNTFRATTGGMIDGGIGQAFLVQKSETSGFSAVQIRANVDLSICNGWKRSKGICDRKNTHYNESDRNYNNTDAQCWNVNHFVVNPNKKTKSKYWQKIYTHAKERDIGKATYIVNSFWRTSRCHFVALRYYSNPQKFGFPLESSGWKDSEWHRDHVGSDLRRERFVAAAKEVGERLEGAVERGFEKELNGWTSDIVLEFE